MESIVIATAITPVCVLVAFLARLAFCTFLVLYTGGPECLRHVGAALGHGHFSPLLGRDGDGSSRTRGRSGIDA